MKEKIQEEIEQMTMVNDTMKASAGMVGFDVDAETEKFLERADNRVTVNLWQIHFIKALESLLEEEDEGLECDVCHKVKPDVMVQSCAYQVEINDDKEYTEQICDECEQIHRDDI